MSGMLVQPWLGYWHHRRYRVLRKQTVWTHTHVWLGRVLLVLGIVNGGIGFSFAKGTVAYSQIGMIVYAVFASVAGLTVVALVVYTLVIERREKSNEYNLS